MLLTLFLAGVVLFIIGTLMDKYERHRRQMFWEDIWGGPRK